MSHTQIQLLFWPINPNQKLAIKTPMAWPTSLRTEIHYQWSACPCNFLIEDYTDIFYTIYKWNVPSIRCKKRLRLPNSVREVHCQIFILTDCIRMCQRQHHAALEFSEDMGFLRFVAYSKEESTSRNFRITYQAGRGGEWNSGPQFLLARPWDGMKQQGSHTTTERTYGRQEQEFRWPWQGVVLLVKK
jgi:hypothetical protein